MPVPQQVGGLFIGGAFRKLMDIDAAIGENSGLAVNPANTRVGSDNAFESLSSYSSRHSFQMLPIQVILLARRDDGLFRMPNPKVTNLEKAVKLFIAQRFHACHFCVLQDGTGSKFAPGRWM